MIPGGGGGGSVAGARPYLLQGQHGLDGMDSAAFMGEQQPDTHCHALLYNLSVLKDRVQQLQPLVGLAVAHDGGGGGGPLDVSAADAIIQEIVAAASNMMYSFQLLCDLGASTANSVPQEARIPVVNNNHNNHDDQLATDEHRLMQQQQWQQSDMMMSLQQGDGRHNSSRHVFGGETGTTAAGATETIIELDAAELLAKYTHYCQVCGKGFKRDANLRMHMRAHGDEYKSNAALSKPVSKAAAKGGEEAVARNKYSCPQEGCRWNRRHAKFQPLKSVICAKNHYKRSHCPKMYVCNRCGRKHFSVLSDLRTHEKHCGDHRWLCSCGTSFSRKDKLAGHLALFAGHQPLLPLDAKRRSSSSSSSSVAAGNQANTTAPPLA